MVRIAGDAIVVLPPVTIKPTEERLRRQGGMALGQRMVARAGGRPLPVPGYWANCTTPLEIMARGFGWWRPAEAERYRRAARDFARLAAAAGVRRPVVVAQVDLARPPSRIPSIETEEREMEASAELAELEKKLPQRAYGLLFSLVVLQEMPPALERYDGMPPGQAMALAPLRLSENATEADRRAAAHLARQGELLLLDPPRAYVALRQTFTRALEALADALKVGHPRPGEG